MAVLEEPELEARYRRRVASRRRLLVTHLHGDLLNSYLGQRPPGQVSIEPTLDEGRERRILDLHVGDGGTFVGVRDHVDARHAYHLAEEVIQVHGRLANG